MRPQTLNLKKKIPKSRSKCEMAFILYFLTITIASTSTYYAGASNPYNNVFLSCASFPFPLSCPSAIVFLLAFHVLLSPLFLLAFSRPFINSTEAEGDIIRQADRGRHKSLSKGICEHMLICISFIQTKHVTAFWSPSPLSTPLPAPAKNHTYK